VNSCKQLRAIVDSCEQLGGSLRAVGSGRKRLGAVVSSYEQLKAVAFRI